MSTPFRLELVSSPAELFEALSCLKGLGINRINLPHLTAGTASCDLALHIRQVIPEADICTHLSLRHFEDLQHVANFAALAENSGVNSLLVVSGSPPGTLSILDALTLIAQSAPRLQLACAFNPFQEGYQLGQECLRLHQKAAATLLSAAYMQIGEDCEQATQGLATLRQTLPKSLLHAGIALPTPALRDRLRHKPIAGVQFSERWLTDEEYAWHHTVLLARTYLSLGVIPLIHAIPFSASGLQRFSNAMRP
jgi:hypothetical protein